MLNLLGLSAFVQQFAAAARASGGMALNFTVGSIWRAMAEANAAVALWLQWLIVVVLGQTRLATSTGAAADSFVNDFGLTRLPAVAAIGVVTFSRFTAGLAAFVPVGAVVRTTDGTQSFAVVADTTNAAYASGGYTVAAGALSIDLPVQSVAGGGGGNIQAGAVSVLATAIAGIDTVSNAAPTAGGYDQESDAALRVRFQLFVDSRSRGTAAAVAFAVASVQQGLTYSLAENAASDGTVRQGFFTVTLDDGTGSPSAALLATVFTAIDAIRPVGTSFAVVPPATVPATVSVAITAQPGYRQATLIAQVSAALTSYIDGLGIGVALPYTRLAQVSYLPGVANVQNVLLNGNMADIGGGPSQVVRATTVIVS